ncbi:MAG TPA: lipoyl domain-containing protein [Pirellulaceae bacterium]|nr:lipoyl domain-containing protein [Pirellulaceae bacterium]
MNLPSRRCELTLPELGLPGATITASVWLSDLGATVYEGDRLLEINVGEATIDLPAPISGVLIEQCVAEDDLLHVGQRLGIVQAAEA